MGKRAQVVLCYSLVPKKLSDCDHEEELFENLSGLGNLSTATIKQKKIHNASRKLKLKNNSQIHCITVNSKKNFIW